MPTTVIYITNASKQTRTKLHCCQNRVLVLALHKLIHRSCLFLCWCYFSQSQNCSVVYDNFNRTINENYVCNFMGIYHDSVVVVFKTTSVAVACISPDYTFK